MSYFRKAIGLGRGMGCCGLGDAAPPATPVAVLAAQVNRFGPEAPAAYRFVTAPLPPTLDMSLALAALTIYLRRSTDAYTQIPDQGTLEAINAANAGFASPVAFVGTHAGEMTTVIRDFADSVGLPAAAGDGSGTSVDSAVVLAAAILVGWWLLEKR